MYKKLFLLICCLLPISIIAQEASIGEFTKGMDVKEGLFTIYQDKSKGKLYLTVNELEKEFLYYTSLAQGLGSNDIGLDRGRLGSEHVVQFEKHGNKILLLEKNYDYRALSNDPLETKAVEESFAKSVHFGFEIVAKGGNEYLIDLTPFMMRDVLGAANELKSGKQGSFSFDKSKSAIYDRLTKNFPQNTELESIITLTGSSPGRELRSVVPTATNITYHQHQSFVALPETPLEMRKHDPRIGYIGISFYDYASPISEPIEKHYISRHRLEKKNPRAEKSEAIEPIIYYMDPGAPEPIRSALMEGAAWWNQAFEAAGYKNAFQVKLLPPDADPMDIRYNLIQWVHRSTRGWSYGGSIIDPRTGEILKGKVTLGSLRVRQDFLIAQGLIGDYSKEGGNETEMIEMALQRLRQLAAHEVGHTIGLPHNYIASTQDRASVMDYPHPLVELEGGDISLSNAYDQKIGEYDKVSIQYGYGDFKDDEALNTFVENTIAKGLRFLTDQDARPVGSENPYAHLWDNGGNAAQSLEQVTEIRARVLANFDENKIPKGQSLATLQEVFVPMYMFHRFQLQSAAKVIGGADYNFSKSGDGQMVYKPVQAKEQTEALKAVLYTLDPGFLAVPEQLIGAIPPRPFREWANSKEVFNSQTGLSFDLLAPVHAASHLTLNFLLHPDRCNRLSLQQVYDKSLPNLEDVLGTINRKTWGKAGLFNGDTYESQIQRVVASNYLKHHLALLVDPNISVDTEATLWQNLAILEELIEDQENTAFGKSTLALLERFEDAPESFKKLKNISIPNGQPIEPGYDWLDEHCSFKKDK